MRNLAAGLTLALGLTTAATAAEPVRVGVVISETGPGASLGIPEGRSIRLLPKEFSGQPVEWIVLDDGSDTTRAVTNMRKLITDNRVDAVVGSTVTPASIAMVEVAAEQKVPTISLAGSATIVSPVDEKRRWVFKTAQNDALMATAVADHMAKAGVKRLALVSVSDSYGDGWLGIFKPLLEQRNIAVAADERYARTDTSVTGQSLKVIAGRPDAVFIISAGTPAALPAKTLRERGFRGAMYQTHGVANADFLRIGGKDVEGTILPVGPVVVADQLPETHPSRDVARQYRDAYEAAHGAGSVSAFGSYAYDAGILLQHAIPVALKTAQPGTPEFRAALRDALEGLKGVVYVNGTATMSPADHVGQDENARVMAVIKDGKWQALPQ
ncbi:ABC transporter substrate-binding protein [Roseomonas marmotae]|uniref:ABC transporter substrate-binding protein n=1 Tax=Roseomonas marmotae TaxID=2768161 RepID=A0ABS3K9F8_9PROT|nr:ABC transporter substrate-binding protein [Roseomonas marmotae]MBO1074093.1 ABC transporter substrate-binding protein [Roseomonas marmotae]QTI78876.1 ABC transporter substrate-binding protein [Roseomonas marmotae]